MHRCRTAKLSDEGTLKAFFIGELFFPNFPLFCSQEKQENLEKVPEFAKLTEGKTWGNLIS